MTLTVLWLLLAIFGAVAFFHFRRRANEPAPAPQLDPLDRLLRSTFERSPVGIGYTDANGAWLFVNRRLMTMLGYQNLEILNVPLRVLTHVDDRKRETAMLAAAKSGKTSGYALVKRLRRKTGEYHSFRVQMLRCGDDQNPVYQCIVEEIVQQTTSMEQIVSALQAVEEAAVIHCDASAAITGWTRGAERLFGRSETQVLGTQWHALHGMHHVDASELLAEAAQSGRLERKITRKHPDGSEYTIDSTIIPYSQMSSTGFIEICREPGSSDLTALRKENQELRAQCETLRTSEASLASATSGLRASNAELSRKLRVLASGIRKLMAERDAAAPGSRANLGAEALPAPASPDVVSGETLDDALRQVVEQGRTGTLQIRSADGEQRIVFEEGRLVAFSSGRKESFLGQLLVDGGVITEEQRLAALREHRDSGRPFGSSLVHLGFATASDLATVIRTKAQRELAESASWEGSTFTFVEGDGAERGFEPVAIDVLSVLAEIGSDNGHKETMPPPPAQPANSDRGRPPASVRTEGNGRYYVARSSRSSSSRSATYHTPDCTSVRLIPEKSRIRFNSDAEARASSYAPCKRCVGSGDARL